MLFRWVQGACTTVCCEHDVLAKQEDATAVDPICCYGQLLSNRNLRHNAFVNRRHLKTLNQCPLLGVKRTFVQVASMSAFDPKRTFGPKDYCYAKWRLAPISPVVNP